MVYSPNKCQEIAAKITALEEALDNISLEGGVTQIQDGSQSTHFTGPRVTQIQNRLDHYKRLYSRGACPAVLGHNDVDLTSSRGNIKPHIGYT